MEQTEDPAAHRNTPASARANQFAATVAGYRAQAIADGLPSRCVPGFQADYYWCLHSHRHLHDDCLPQVPGIAPRQ